jgi:hypothetical protein
MVSFATPILGSAQHNQSGGKIPQRTPSKDNGSAANTLLTAELRHNGVLDAVFSCRRAAISSYLIANVARKLAHRPATAPCRALNAFQSGHGRLTIAIVHRLPQRAQID